MKHLILSLSVFLSICLHVFADGFDGNPQHYLGFIENKGQVHDQSGNPRDDVKFIFQKNDFKLILKQNGFSIEFTKTTLLSAFPESGVFENETANDENANLSFQQTINRIDVALKDCNSNPEIIAENPLQLQVHRGGLYFSRSSLLSVLRISFVLRVLFVQK